MLLGHGTRLKFWERLCENVFSCLLKEAREVAVVTLVGHSWIQCLNHWCVCQDSVVVCGVRSR